MRKKRYIYIFLLSVCLFVFNSCGLDVVYYLQAPQTAHNIPTASTEYDNRYFEFTTNNSQGNIADDFDFLGTAVYYKIYNNSSTMANNISTLSSLSSSANESAAATKLIDGFKYKPLGTSNGTKDPLIAAESYNQRVYIRLSNYQENVSGEYKAVIKVRRNSDGAEWEEIGIPLRTGNRYTFDFGRDEDKVLDSLAANKVKNAVPAEDDSSSIGDVTYSSTFSDSDKKLWYVDMYAVAVGQDNSFTPYYSNILHLGSVTIDPNEDNN